MFELIKDVLMLVLISASNLFLLTNSTKCLSLKNKECKVRKVIVDNEYMTSPYKIEIHKGIGSCNNISNPYSKTCFPDIINNFSVTVFNLISTQNEITQVSFHESCKCDYLLNEAVCNDKQKWSKDECRYECLKINKYSNGFVWNINNCECEYGKAVKLTTEEECEEIIDNITRDKTVSITKYLKSCKPFVASSILLASVSIILTGTVVYFYVKSRQTDASTY